MVKIIVEFFTPSANETARKIRKQLTDAIEKAVMEAAMKEEEFAVNMTQ